MPSVSVVIPVYGRGVLLRDAIESVLMQDYKPLEIIVFDDGSPIPVSNYISSYMPLVRYIRSENNRGVSYGRNIGISEAKSDYIAFLDSDDIWLPNKLSVQMNNILNKSCKISHTNEFWFRKGRWLNQGTGFNRYGGDIFTKVLDKCRVSPSSLIIRNGIGFFDENLRVCEDYEFILRFSLKYEIDYTEEKLLIKRSVSDDQLSKGIKYIESVRYGILKDFYDNHVELAGERKIAVLKELKRKEIITGGRRI